MKLAELLLKRSDLQKRIATLRERIAKNAKIQEGSKAHESAEALLEQALAANRELHRVVVALHEANLAARLDDGRSLTAAVAQRDQLAAEHALLRAAVDAAVAEVDRYGSRELRWVSTLDVAALHRRADAAAEHLRDLNVEIQRVNWVYDVPEGTVGVE